MIDLGTGNNNKINWCASLPLVFCHTGGVRGCEPRANHRAPWPRWPLLSVLFLCATRRALTDKQEMIDIIETIYRGARKGRGLVVSPKDYSTKYRCVPKHRGQGAERAAVPRSGGAGGGPLHVRTARAMCQRAQHRPVHAHALPVLCSPRAWRATCCCAGTEARLEGGAACPPAPGPLSPTSHRALPHAPNFVQLPGALVTLSARTPHSCFAALLRGGGGGGGVQHLRAGDGRSVSGIVV